MANRPAKTIKFPGLEHTYTFLQDDTTLSVAGEAADAKATGDALAAVQAQVDGVQTQVDGVQAGQYPDMGAGQLLSESGTANPTPYTYRENASGSDRVTVQQITGGTVAFNQLVDTATTSVTVASGHKYVALVGGTWSVGTSDGTALTVTGGTDMVFDLTQMFGAAVAQYFLDLETANAGAGVALFRAMFPGSYYPYNSGELVSVQTSGRVSGDQTYPLDSTLTLRGIPVLTDDGKVAYDGDQYTPDGTVTRRYRLISDLGAFTWSYSEIYGVFFTSLSDVKGVHATYQVLASGKYAQSKSKYNANFQSVPDKIICLVSGQTQLAIKDTDYTDGTAFKAAVTGISAVVAINTPITETAAPYQSIQIAGSTEEFLPPETDTRAVAVPVGSVSLYQTNLREGLEKVLGTLNGADPAHTESIAPVQGNTASTNIASGELLMRDGKLYQATQAIVAGAEIGATNTTETTLAAQIAALEARIAALEN